MNNNQDVCIKGSTNEVMEHLNDFRETVNAKFELHYDLKMLADKSLDLPNATKENRSALIKIEEPSNKWEDKAIHLLACLKEMRDKTWDKDEKNNVYRELLIIIFDFINNLCNTFKENILLNEVGQNYDFDISCIARIIQIMMMLLGLFGQNVESFAISDILTNKLLEENNLNKVKERINNLEVKTKNADQEIAFLKNTLERAMAELELIILCQQQNVPQPENNKKFKENLELSLIKKEFEKLKLSYVELEYTNKTLEHKTVNLLNNINCLISKNLILEDRIKQTKKKSSHLRIISSNKHLTRNDLLLQIKEQSETINNMATHNSQLNNTIVRLKKEHKLSSQSYFHCKGAVVDKEIQYMKLQRSVKELKYNNNKLENIILANDRKIKELESELYRFINKAEMLCVQLSASEAIRLSLELNLQDNNLGKEQVCIEEFSEFEEELKQNTNKYDHEQEVDHVMPSSNLNQNPNILDETKTPSSEEKDMIIIAQV